MTGEIQLFNSNLPQPKKGMPEWGPAFLEALEQTRGGTDDRGQPVSSGVYLYRVQAAGFSETRKMLLLR